DPTSDSLTIGAAYHGNWNSFTINQTAGTLTSNSRFDMGGATGSGGSTYQSYYNLSGGRLDLNSHDFRLGYSNAGDGNRTYLNLSGSGILDFVNANVGRADLRISGGTLTGSGLFKMNHTDFNPLLWIDGSSALSISFGSMNAYNGGSATIRYTMDASGVTAMDVGTLNLNSGANVSMLEVDMTNWDGVSGLNNGHIILANYTTLNGTFSSVNVTGGSGTVVYDYDAGDGGTAIALYVVPEPGTLLLTGVGLMCCGMARRKKRR
ncbi:MAG: PEP-CTERM sorting domain-containing protein, partial [Kiritimatiellia bacterium]